MGDDALPHLPVLLLEVLSLFQPVALKVFVDGTIGGGGHAAALLGAHPEIERYIALDQDPEALEIAKKSLAHWKSKVSFHRANFEDLNEVLFKEGNPLVDGILLDIGVSSMQLDVAERGFSFRNEGPLDMRMDPQATTTAEGIVNTWSEGDLGELFRSLGEEKLWRRAARAIVRKRNEAPITTTTELEALLYPVLRNPKERATIHPVTRVFQALRIAVNRELDVLKSVVPAAIGALAPKGRLGIITFHSLEDRIVKQAFQYGASDKENTSGPFGIFVDKDPIVNLLTRKPMTPTVGEISANPRSRSAKLRGIEKR